MNEPTTDRADWRNAIEERQAARRALQDSDASCTCRHPKDRHVKLGGVYCQCQWYYGRGEGKCPCGGYQPQPEDLADQTQPTPPADQATQPPAGCQPQDSCGDPAAHLTARLAPATAREALRGRIAEVLLTTRRADYADLGVKANHREYRFDARCALCTYDVEALADAVLAVLPAPDQEAVPDVRPQTLTSLAAHLDARAVAILRPESQTYAEWQTVIGWLRRLADEARSGQPETD
ncbi:hypothetical protein [Streptomyces rubradiris]|uniref:Uncharacterized protein n=1 Tax=Streptomyces rubradiris TaxID=285531 RepID=A0ABQ3R3G4_STRRR|nr:hypothetical protein [Streptomyces rubradiris]GHH30089.1 hypothetical protein GCM10018792_76070 [Streptomyces rubradiris]GHI50388.1 hypothetical protein Srubr_02340 [Streptomyces rubradiris]